MSVRKPPPAFKRLDRVQLLSFLQTDTFSNIAGYYMLRPIAQPVTFCCVLFC